MFMLLVLIVLHFEINSTTLLQIQPENTLNIKTHFIILTRSSNDNISNDLASGSM